MTTAPPAFALPTTAPGGRPGLRRYDGGGTTALPLACPAHPPRFVRVPPLAPPTAAPDGRAGLWRDGIGGTAALPPGPAPTSRSLPARGAQGTGRPRTDDEERTV